MSREDMEQALRDKIEEDETPSAEAILESARAVESAFREKVEMHEPPWPETSYAWIVPYAETFCEPDPEKAMAMATSFGETRKNLQSGQVSAVQGLTPMVEDWEGSARDSFYENFLVPFPDAIDNQTEVVDELRLAIWSYESVLRSGRRDAKLVFDKTKQVVDGFDGDKTAGASFGFSIVIAVSGILGAVPSGGATLGLAMIGGSAIMGNAVIAAEQTAEGTTLGEIMTNMQKQLTDLRTEMDNQEEQIGDALLQSKSTVDEIIYSEDATTLSQLLPNEGTGSGGRTSNEGALDDDPLTDGGMELGIDDGDDSPDIIDGKENDKDEFRPPS